MKTATARYKAAKTHEPIPYPNAASRKELINKFLDLLLTGALGAAMAAFLLFLMVIA